MTDELSKFHLRKGHQVGLSEGNQKQVLANFGVAKKSISICSCNLLETGQHVGKWVENHFDANIGVV